MEWKFILRPYNYYFLSFVTKMLMFISLPLFHQYPFAQFAILVALQLLEIIRFTLTKPYALLIKTIFKYLMELSLLAIFILGIVISEFSYKIM